MVMILSNLCRWKSLSSLLQSYITQTTVLLSKHYCYLPQPIVLVTLLLCCCKYCIYISSKSSIHKFDLLLKTGSLEILDRLELAGVAVAERGKLNSLIDSRLIL